MKTFIGPEGRTFGVTVVHGESRSWFHVVDVDAPEADQPAILASYPLRWQAENHAISGCACPMGAHYYGVPEAGCTRK